jgi:hypothetical protein
MAYFEDFRRIQYQFPDNVRRIMADLSIRPKFREKVLENSGNFEFYEIKDGDTPEALAKIKYNDQNLHWGILLANEIVNIYQQWPKSNSQFDEYMYQKYKVQYDSDAQANVTLSRIQVTEFVQFKGLSDSDNYGNLTYRGFVSGTGVRKQPKLLRAKADLSAYSGTVSNETFDYSIDTNISTSDAWGGSKGTETLTPVSIEDWEVEQNDLKRKIILPKRKILNKVKDELEGLING